MFCEYGPNFWQIKNEGLGKLKILLICENINFKGELFEKYLQRPNFKAFLNF
jgi:hypothetical protein